MLMDSCPVCYSSFSAEEEETVARKLPCDHVACTQCLQDCFEDATERRDPSEPVRANSLCWKPCLALPPKFCFTAVVAVEARMRRRALAVALVRRSGVLEWSQCEQ